LQSADLLRQSIRREILTMNRMMNGESRVVDMAPGHSAPSVRTTARNEVMKRLLTDLRDQELHRVRALMHSETDLAAQAPGDELDQASRDGDLEFHASLLDLAERRLMAIASTLTRIDEGRFGLCEECGEQISLTRLQSVPFARYCFDCQKEMEAASRRTRSKVSTSAWPTNICDSYHPESERVASAADNEEGQGSPSGPARRRRTRRARN
jgi:DnaK suppressor protein